MISDTDIRMLDEWLQGCISDEDFAIMQQRLSDSADLRKRLRSMADLDEGLSCLALRPVMMLSDECLLPRLSEERPARFGAGLPWIVAGAAALLAFIAWMPHFHPGRTGVGRSVTALLVDEAGADLVFCQVRL